MKKKCLSFESLIVVIAVLIVSNLIIAWSVWTFLGMQLGKMQTTLLMGQKTYCQMDGQAVAPTSRVLGVKTQDSAMEELETSVSVR